MNGFVLSGNANCELCNGEYELTMNKVDQIEQTLDSNHASSSRHILKRLLGQVSLYAYSQLRNVSSTPKLACSCLFIAIF